MKDLTMFIVTSTALLKWLLEANLDNVEYVDFEVSKDKIKCSVIDREYYANDILRAGTFSYSKEQVQLLINILKPIPEEPLAIKFDSWIWIQQVMI